MKTFESTTPAMQTPSKTLEPIQKKGYKVISYDNDDDIIIKGGNEELSKEELKYLVECFTVNSFVILNHYKEKGKWFYWLYTGPTSAHLIKVII